MSYYVRRTRLTDGRVSWTGPIRTIKQADKERDAWHSTGDWTASTVPTDPTIRAEVRAWVKARRLEQAR